MYRVQLYIISTSGILQGLKPHPLRIRKTVVLPNSQISGVKEFRPALTSQWNIILTLGHPHAASLGYPPEASRE